MNWKNWAGNVTANPQDICVAGCEQQLVDILSAAVSIGQPVRAVGTGHSFSEICATKGVLVSLDNIKDVKDIKDCQVTGGSTATLWAGTKIGNAAEELWRSGYSFPNQGDIDVQSMAGALGTGTHGTGKSFGSFSASAVALRLVTADCSICEINRNDDPELLRAAALSVGMLGLVSEIALRVCPAFHLREQTQVMEVNACLDLFSAAQEPHRNMEFYWVPTLDQCVAKTMDLASEDDITAEDDSELPPPGTIERYLRPERTNQAYQVFRNIRTVPFLEMEYSVPLASGPACFGEIRNLMRRKFPDKSWVVEYRTQAADDLMLSPAQGRTVAAISVHDEPNAPRSEDYFRKCEEVFLAYDGRPHWGKLCFLSPSQRADRFPEFQSFSSIRQRLDSQGVFLNDYLRPLFR